MDKTLYCPNCELPLHQCGAHVADKCAGKPATKPGSIHFSALQATSSISALGLVAARMLQEHHQVTLMVSTDGFVEVVPLGELELDNWSEDDALTALVGRGYTDNQLADYLRQRSIRRPSTFLGYK